MTPPVDEVQRYVEDVGLWGFNTLIVWYDMHHFQGFDSPEAVAFRKRLKAICGAARRIGLDVGFASVANEGYANSPVAIRADVKGMRGRHSPPTSAPPSRKDGGMSWTISRGCTPGPRIWSQNGS